MIFLCKAERFFYLISLYYVLIGKRRLYECPYFSKLVFRAYAIRPENIHVDKLVYSGVCDTTLHWHSFNPRESAFFIISVF